MKITLLTVGRLKEKYWRSAAEEYVKRLSRYCKLTLIELPDEKCPENASSREMEGIKKKEAAAIRSKLPADAFLITLEIGGKEYDSEGFSSMLETLPHRGHSHIAFVIGGSLGLDGELCRQSGQSLSFGKMTYPHQMMKVILLEQIYRAFRIMRNEPYHK